MSIFKIPLQVGAANTGISQTLVEFRLLEIAYYVGGKGTVLGILRRAGTAMRAQGLGPGDLPRAIALYESGLSSTR